MFSYVQLDAQAHMTYVDLKVIWGVQVTLEARGRDYIPRTVMLDHPSALKECALPQII